MTDEELARSLQGICEECETNTANPGFIYCESCYSRRTCRNMRRRICQMCMTPLRELQICNVCDTPAEDASYEAMLEWEAKHAPKNYNPFIAHKFPTSTADKCIPSGCVICLSDIEIGDNIMRLPCTEAFHTECISKWIQDNPSCPVCKTDLTLF
jgi:hypothetical protein